MADGHVIVTCVFLMLSLGLQDLIKINKSCRICVSRRVWISGIDWTFAGKETDSTVVMCGRSVCVVSSWRQGAYSVCELAGDEDSRKITFSVDINNSIISNATSAFQVPEMDFHRVACHILVLLNRLKC